MTRFARFVFFVVGNWKGLLFRIGLRFIRMSSWGLALSSNDGWVVSHWSKDKCPLIGDCRIRYTEELKQLLWFCAEPAWVSGYGGTVPRCQYELIAEIVTAQWSGGRTVALRQLLDEVAASEKLHISN